ncbi:hypothetical protein K1T71_009811 [Dendrolimus kikuchii]|uniref:Uncharacterized protein n=1 Tax=Dendrolimus kikuchii TaxID=765133 RepID=A0ACC1CT19_9NEOP|nr:hypothetical protein K1T71_009811 [Dendrolimus kikuchii]
MEQLTLIILVLIIGTVVWCNADFPDYSSNNKGNVEDVSLEDEELSRSSASAQAFASANAMSQGRLRPSPMPALNQRLLECFTCTDCPTVLSNTTTKFCPASTDPSRRGCVVYSEKYAHMKRPWFIRGCASERGNCQDLHNSHEAHKNIVDMTFCYNCEGDRCNVNGVTQSLPSWTIGVLVLIVTPLLGKHTLS